MIKKLVYNKNKVNCIIFFHGLYANSGFWLPYFKYFKNYKLVFFEVDYQKLVFDNRDWSNIFKDFKSSDDSENIVAIISHSLGTLVADLMFSNCGHSMYNICPIFRAKKIESEKFVDFISNKIQLPLFEVNECMSQVNVFINSVKENLKFEGYNFIPSNDSYFIYEKFDENISFVGDHFEVLNAIEILFKDFIPDKGYLITNLYNENER